MRSRKEMKAINPKSWFGIIFFIIFLFAIILFQSFNRKITPNLITIAESSINKLNESVLLQYRVSDVYQGVELEDVIKLTKNKNDEIIAVDFKLENAYKALSIITKYLQNSFASEKIRNQILTHYNEDLSSDLDSIILSIPMGVMSKGIYLANLGPRIPVKVNYMGYIGTNIRIKLEDYGINNVLVSLYIDCEITNEFIVPATKRVISHSYSILIASKIIQGIVPEYYGGSMETKSNILNVPIN